MLLRFTSLCVILFAAASALVAADAPAPLEQARIHLQKGRYAEAVEAYEELAANAADPVPIALGLSQAHQAVGDWKQATDTLESAVKKSPKSAPLWARLAEVQFLQGRYQQAEKCVAEALALDADNPLARLVQADLLTETGKIAEASTAYRWFVGYYNRAQPTDAQTLLVVARGTVQYARWQRGSKIFNFAVNTLCPDALKSDENCWQSYYVSGSLLLEKYNRAQAVPEFKQALAINAQAADVLVGMAEAAWQDMKIEEADEFLDRALAIDKQLVSAHRLKAQMRLAGGNVSQARQHVEKALAVNPIDQRTLAVSAACDLIEDGPPDAATLERLFANLETAERISIDKPDRFTQLTIDLARRNPHPGYFLTLAGEAMENQRRFDLAERFYQQAIKSMPELAEPRTALAMLYMQIGKTDAAGTLLDEAFRADPYHVRVSNMRKVLKLLGGYESVATDHFVIRFDSQQDKVLARYMAEYLEAIYPQLVKEFGYEPPTRTQFEIYNDAKGLSAHEWFSARMVGLPWIQTIGASTGKIVALASPTAAEEPFNWARVLKHEFVHIITLGQTDFRIPHWFTEALAVRAEGYPRPENWNALLRERVPSGDLRTLADLNDGFTRPKSPDDWQFAYCQSRLYADYMDEKFGKEMIPKLLEAYRKGLPTERAIPEAGGGDLASFENGYREYIGKLTAALGAAKGARREARSLAELEKAYQADSNDMDLGAEYAAALLRARKVQQARQLAERVLSKDKTQPVAAMVLADLELKSGDAESAIARLDAALDRAQPDRGVLIMLAKLKLARNQMEQAAELLQLGREKYPGDVNILKGLCAAYSKLGKKDALKPALLELVRLEADNADSRYQLAALFLEEKNFEQARAHALESLYVDVLEPDTHRILAEAHFGLGQFEAAAREYETALELKSPDKEKFDRDAVETELARTLIALKRPDDARARLQAVLTRKPDHAEAKKLLDNLK